MKASATTSPHPGSETGSPLVEIRDLSIRFALARSDVLAVNGISLEVAHGEVFALVGESGSGKSVTALSIMGLLEQPPAVVSGSIRLDGVDIAGLGPAGLSRIRGLKVGMVFQDPMSSLNPVHPIGRQIGESLRLHLGASRRAARARAVDLLDRVGIPDATRRVDDYPHEFSGGMRQRAMIAMALACDPMLLIADEPTTALDVTVQDQIVALVRELQAERRMSVIWITHDLGVVAEIADRVAVMYAGRILEEGPAAEIYSTTRHPYTSGLLHSIPRMDRDTGTRLAEIPGTPKTVTEPLTGCAFHDRCPLGGEDCVDGLPELMNCDRPQHRTACIHFDRLAAAPEPWSTSEAGGATPDGLAEVVVEVSDLHVHYQLRRKAGRRRGVVKAVDGVDLVVRKGRTLGVVGESGCGKTTLGRSLVGLVAPTSGTITVHGAQLEHRGGRHRRVVQMIFQDPFSSMNPGMRVRQVIGEPMTILGICPRGEIPERVDALLEQVGLSAEVADRYPHEFSGGQRQRIAVARALAAQPEVIVCDEPVSALDVSVQAQIINLLHEIQTAVGLAFVFIAHDLAVVRHISHEVAVMYLGQVVERGPRDALYGHPQHPYTKALLAAVPIPDPGVKRHLTPLEGDLPSPSDPPAGCRFHTRCPVAVPGLCDVEAPELRETAPDRWVACHLVTATIAGTLEPSPT